MSPEGQRVVAGLGLLVLGVIAGNLGTRLIDAVDRYERFSEVRDHAVVDIHDGVPVLWQFEATQVVVTFDWLPPDDPRLQEVWGESSFYYDEETGTSLCVVSTSYPVHVDDVWSDTLGHELMHCIAGDYHE